MSASLIICLSSLAVYIAITVLYLIKIKKAKYQAAPRIIPKPNNNFYFIFVLSLILILLPIVIPLETYVIAIVCLCAIMGLYIILKERLDEIKKMTDKK